MLVVVEDVEEGRVARVQRAPGEPTAREREVHEATHLCAVNFHVADVARPLPSAAASGAASDAGLIRI